MTLRKQLIFVSLCLLALPWAGCQYVKEMESVLRHNQQQLLQSAALPIAHIVSDTLSDNYSTHESSPRTLYTPYRSSPIAIDGYDDEWKSYAAHPLVFVHHKKGSAISTSYFKTTISDQNLLLFFHIEDNNIVYHHPSAPSPTHNDHLKITTGSKNNRQHIVIYTSGQGGVQAVYSDSDKIHWQPLPPPQRIQGYWQEIVNEKTKGYNIELSIPLKLLSENLEFSTFNLDIENHQGQSSNKSLNKKHSVAQHQLSSLQQKTIQPIFSLTEQLRAFQQPAWDIAIVDNNGWLLSPQHLPTSTPKAVAITTPSSSPSLWESALSRFYRYIMENSTTGNTGSNTDTAVAPNTMPLWPFNSFHLSQSKKQIPLDVFNSHHSQWYQVANSQRSILSVINPVRHNQTQETIGYVILTQSSEALLSLTNTALLRIINLSLSTAALSAAILLGFASILSYRIRHLRNQAEKAVTTDGKVQPFLASRANDEIGDLSRSYALLLHRVQDYNHYLETLSGKLAHELRTPLTISKSSIEMLKMVDSADTAKQQRYLTRAEEGLERLRLILNAMSEASRVEQVIQHSEMQRVDVKQLMEEISQAYQDSYPDFMFAFHAHDSLSATDSTLLCAPELIAQMLDKLVDNATGFSPPKSTIQLYLTPYANGLRITIENTGPLLPDNMQQLLFDSMVSIRKEKTDTPHLGLGLYIVKLIAQHHHGKLSASNNPENTGVRFCVDLPTH